MNRRKFSVPLRDGVIEVRAATVRLIVPSQHDDNFPCEFRLAEVDRVVLLLAYPIGSRCCPPLNLIREILELLLDPTLTGACSFFALADKQKTDIHSRHRRVPGWVCLINVCDNCSESAGGYEHPSRGNECAHG